MLNQLKRWTLLAFTVIILCTSFSCRSTPIVETEQPAPDKVPSPAYPTGAETMTPVECGRCHTRYYELIKNQGGKHRIDCQECHERFHVFVPGKIDYEDVMPKCDSCHEEVHGPDLADCSTCHSEAHAPLNIPANRVLEHGCYICHPETDQEMKTYITQHTEFYCFTCHHTRHRTVPGCLECHQPHAGKEINQFACMDCHPPHKALQVVYEDDISRETCASCHRYAYDTLKQSGTKHMALGCAACHPEEHRAITQCQECHEKPHGEEILKAYPVCGRCHGTAHSLIQ